MKSKAIILLIVLHSLLSFSQSGFTIEGNRDRVVIPFKFTNNLAIIPIEVNGTKLNFLLDSGVEETILFSLENEEIKFSNLEKVMFRGIGSNQPFEGLRSSGNRLKVNGFNDLNHTIYIVLDQNINISSQVGIPVNGIIGYHFFKNNCVDINYNKKKIVVYNTIAPISKKLKRNFQEIPISIEENKPYLTASVLMEKDTIALDAKLLIDIGNSDALWLFKAKDDRIKISDKNFDDYLGLGFSGTVYGKRCRIQKLKIGNFAFEDPIVAIPDSTAIKDINMVERRVGSIGSEIMKRFSIVFDYPNNRVFLKKNANFNLHFNYNMSGIEVQHEGLEWVQETYEENPNSSNIFVDYKDGEKHSKNLKYKFELKPAYSIFSIRKDSPADLAGLKTGDKIATINGRNGYTFNLEEINAILKSEEDRLIVIEVLRNNKPLKFKFKLKNII